MKQVLGLCLIASFAGGALASPNLSGGVWFNYRYVDDNDRDDETIGDFADEAFILYADGKAKEGEGIWSYSAELRIGPGSFTDTANNSSGDNFTLHKAWIGFDVTPSHKIIVGKSQVPFAWKTSNFWPGDMFQAAYGDQMDVGVKVEGQQTQFNYALAYYHADDWGETSTDSTDDNRHWGSSTTYRKVQTFVADFKYPLDESHTLGASAQAGKLQDLISAGNPVDGDHNAFALYYLGQFGKAFAKAEYIQGERELPVAYQLAAGKPTTIENSRYGFELGYDYGDWRFLVDATWASPDTKGSTADTIFAVAPAVIYNYGPGWIYLEYLHQDGYIDRDMMINEGDFSALYLSFDFYF